jgi:5-methylthioadenosine/S-adenosylhomocysteine deaminase
MNLWRGYADDFFLKEWLEKKIWPQEKKLTPEDVYWGTKLACLEMIKTGTTCFNDMYWFPLASAQAIQEMGLRAVLGLALLDSSPQGQKEVVEKDFNSFQKNKFSQISLAVVPHSIYTVSKKNLIWAKNFAQKNNLLLHFHLSETTKEVKDCLRKNKMRPGEYLDQLGVLNKNCLCSHAIWLSSREIKILKKRGCHLIYNPGSNMKLASGFFPYQKVKEQKINVCLGTDSACSNNNLDMFEEMKLGALLQRGINFNPRIISVKDIFKMATQNAAEALKIKSGKIAPGYLADLILIDLNQVCLAPGHNLFSDLVYSCSGHGVTDLICGGKILMRDRKVKNEEEIILKSRKMVKKLLKKKINKKK